MSRLIDADAFKKDIKACTMSCGTLINTNTMLALLDKYPTAYNVDAVVTELEHQAEQYRNRGFEHEQKGFSAMADKYYGKQWSYLHAIEIVRNGGVKHG